MLRYIVRRYLPFLLLPALHGCVPVFGTPLSLPPKLEAQRDDYEADLNLAFARVNRFGARYDWSVKAEDLVVDFEVFRYRLNKALELIRERKSNLSEIAYQTGFSSISAFSRAFKQAYGKAPSEM